MLREQPSITRRFLHQLLAAGCLAPGCIAAQDSKSLFLQVTRRYRGLKQYHFEGRTVAQSIFNGRTSEGETGFTVAFEAPARFRLEFRYPSAGNWLRVSDGTSFLESRSLGKEFKVSAVRGREMKALQGSPVYNFERLSKTAVNAMIMRRELIEVDDKKIECDLVQFEAGRRRLREAEWAGPSMVWISRANQLVLREEIRTSAKTGENYTETRKITVIEHFQIDAPLPGGLFDTK